ncbi:hypothetical protein TYRP_022042 [Tyrophagus putrescentiae]|nr:hypothetical protein TYRP_022042 [Tyrophagus putrescentiae]
MNSGSYAASAAVINGCIYVAGGWNKQCEVLNSVCKYCPGTDTWREVAPMTTQRYNFALTPFAGRLWAIGGTGGDNQRLSSCESYDPVTDTWREEAPMKEGRYGHAAMEFNGELYVVGGGNNVKIEKKLLIITDPVLIVEKYLSNKGWIRSGTLQNVIPVAKLIIVPNKWPILVCTCHITSFDYYSTWQSKSLNFEVQVAWVMKN